MTETAAKTLDEFLAEERTRLSRFEAYWLTAQKNDPEHFPCRMEGSDWDEALMMFSE
jgi:hypothetical protein